MRREQPDGPLSILGIAVVVATLIADQAAKAAAEAYLPTGEALDVLPVLSLYRVSNSGIAFSLFRGFGNLGLIAVTLAITVVVLVMWSRAREGGRVAAVGFALIVGGAARKSDRPHPSRPRRRLPAPSLWRLGAVRLQPRRHGADPRPGASSLRVRLAEAELVPRNARLSPRGVVRAGQGDSVSGAPATEIDVTPAMVEAGARFLEDQPPDST